MRGITRRNGQMIINIDRMPEEEAFSAIYSAGEDIDVLRITSDNGIPPHMTMDLLQALGAQINNITVKDYAA